MAGPLRPEHEQLLRKARKALAAARSLQQDGYSEDAISRAYYAMFHATRAFLVKRGVIRHKHSAVIAAFGQVAVKAGLVSGEMYQILTRAFEDRNTADYDAAWQATRQDAQEAVHGARRFLAHVKRIL